jgi:hypothetical protein
MLRRVLCRHNRKPCGVFQPVRSFFLRFEIKKILFCEVMRILRSVGHHLFLKPSVNIIDLQLCMGSPILQPQRIHGGTSINTPLHHIFSFVQASPRPRRLGYRERLAGRDE